MKKRLISLLLVFSIIGSMSPAVLAEPALEPETAAATETVSEQPSSEEIADDEPIADGTAEDKPAELMLSEVQLMALEDEVLDVINAASAEELQSEHPYDDDMNTMWVYTSETAADSVSVTFSEETYVETDCDHIYIYDESDNLIGHYTGSELAGETVEVEGGTIKIRLTTDGSVCEYGFSVADIAVQPAEGVISNLRAITVLRDGVTLAFAKAADAESVTLEQSADGEVWTAAEISEPLTAESRRAEITGLEPETEYYFRLNVSGGPRDGISNVVSVTTRGIYAYDEDFEFDDGVIYQYTGGDSVVYVPPSIGGETVTSIGEHAFSGRSDITAVILPDTVISIGEYAFYNCRSLESIELPDTVTTIGEYAFYNCRSLESIELPENLQALSYYTFHNCTSLRSVTLGVGLESISDNAFSYCSSLESISYSGTAEQWNGIDISTDNAVLFASVVHCSDGDVDMSVKCGKNAVWNVTDEVLTISGSGDTYDYAYGSAPWDSYYFSEVVVEQGITGLGDRLFDDGYGIHRVTLPEGLLSIGEYAFAFCYDLSEIVLPGTLNRIGSYAFESCYLLTAVLIPGGVSCIEENAFSGCSSLSSVTIAEGVETISAGAFYGCRAVSEITIPSTVSAIDSSAFNSCNVRLSVPESSSVFSAADGVLFNKSGTELLMYRQSGEYVVPDGVETIGAYAFASSGVTAVTLCSGLTAVGERAFYDTPIKEIVIPDGVTSIGSYAFYGCSELRGAVIPDSVSFIGENAFSDNYSTAIYASAGSYAAEYAAAAGMLFGEPGGIAQVSGTFGEGGTVSWRVVIENGVQTLTISGTGALGSSDHYSDSYPWSKYSNDTDVVMISNGITEIGEYCFNDFDKVEEITIPGSVKTLGSNAFFNCYGLKRLILEEGVETVSDYALFDCYNLVSVQIPASVTSIGENAFGYSYDRSIVVYTPSGSYAETYAKDNNYIYGEPGGTLKRGGSFGAENELMWELTLDEESGVLTISGSGSYDFDSYAPWGNYSGYIRRAVINDGITAVGDRWFYGCNNMVSAELPAGITYIGRYAFYNCDSLTELELPDGTASIYDYAFRYCDLLTSVTVPTSVVTIGTSVFPSGAVIYTPAGSAAEQYARDNGHLYGEPGGEIKRGGSFGDNGGLSWDLSMDSGILTISGSDSVSSTSLPWNNFSSYIRKAVIESGVTAITRYWFNYCENLTEVVIPDTVTQISSYAFYSCNALRSITIPETISTIESSAFYNCSRLVFFVTPGSAAETYAQEIGCLYGAPGEPIHLDGTSGDIHWSLDISASEGVLTVSGTGELSFERYSWNPWYGYRNYIDKAVVAEGITSIGDYAFYDCEYLKEAALPGSAVSIGYNAFYYCSSLTEISIPENVTSIDSYAFSNCTSLTEINIPNSVTSIGRDAFSDCSSLTEITLPNSVTDIGECAFYGCTSLTGITISDSVTSIGECVFQNCSSLTEISIPESVTSIGDSAFSGCNSLTEINIPESVTSIGYGAFSGCTSLTEINIPEGIASIGDDVFYGCASLMGISIPNSVTSIGSYTFSDCTSLAEISIPNSVTDVGYGAFSGCTSLTGITIPNSVTSIGSDVFSRCTSLTGITIPNSVTSISSGAFEYCSSLTEINIPESVTSIGGNAFSGCIALMEINIPNSVTSIGSYAFSGCTLLTGITIPNSVTSISSGAFEYCSSLTEINIPESVTSIGYCAFNVCSSLTEINIPESVTSIGGRAFSSCTSLTGISIPNSVIDIGEYAFNNCESLTGINIPDGITSIVPNTFSGCTSLTGINIPNSVTNIGEYAFRGCSALTEINIPEGVTSIGGSAFSGCTSLKEIRIPDGVTSIEDYLFSNCTSLAEINIPEGVTSIDSYAFQDCTSLTEVTVPESVTVIDSGAFSGCTSLTGITIPDGVTSIGRYAFRDCALLTEVTIPLNVNSIGSYVFYGCSMLGRVTIYDGVTSIGYDAFAYCAENLRLYVIAGSYACEYAINNDIPYRFIGEGYKAVLTVTDDTGAAPETGVTVRWYADGEPIGTGSEITFSNLTAALTYKIELDEESSFIYKTPEIYTVDTSGDIDEDTGIVLSCVLERLGTTSVSGIVESYDGEPMPGASVSVIQTADDRYTRTIELTTDENGAFSAEVLNMPTRAVVNCDGYYTAAAELIGSTADAGVIRLIKMPDNKITLSMTVRNAVAEGSSAASAVLDSAAGLSFAVRNITKGTELENITVDYPYIILEPEAADVYDELEITAADMSGTMTAEPVVITLDEQKKGTADIEFIKDGAISAELNGTAGVNVMVFGSDGRLVERRAVSTAAYESSGLDEGSYSVVFMQRTSLLSSVPELSRLDDYGLAEGADYVLMDAEVKNGVITELGSVSVPQFDESRLYYTKKENTSVTANKNEVVIGNLVQLRAEYAVDEKYSTTNQSVRFELPDNVSFVGRSVTVNGGAGSYIYQDNVLTVYTNSPSGTVRLYVIPEESGSYALTALLGFTLDGTGITQPIGTTEINGLAASISVPEKVSGAGIAVRGAAIPRSGVKVYDNGELIGETASNAAGSWTAGTELKNTYSVSYHEIYAEITTPYGAVIETEPSGVMYNENYIELSRITVLNDSNVLVTDFLNDSGQTLSYSFGSDYGFTFRVEFTDNDPEKISDVYVVTESSEGDTFYVPCTYDDVKGCWIGSRTYDTTSDIPVSVTAVYDQTEPEVQLFDDDGFVDFIENYNDMYSTLEGNIKQLLRFEEIYDETSETYKMNVGIDMNGETRQLGIYEIAALDYAEFNQAEWENSGYEIISQDGVTMYVRSVMNDDVNEYYVVLPDSRDYIKMSFALSDDDSEVSLFFIGAVFGVAGLISDIVEVYTENKNLNKELETSKELLQSEFDLTLALVAAKCKYDGSYRISSQQQRDAFFDALRVMGSQEYDFSSEMQEAINNKLIMDIVIKAGLNIISKGTGKLVSGAVEAGLNKLLQNPKFMETIWKGITYVEKAGSQFQISEGFAKSLLGNGAGELLKMLPGPSDIIKSLTEPLDVAKLINERYNAIMDTYHELQQDILAAYGPCPPEDVEPDPVIENTPGDTSLKDTKPPIQIKPIIDPSGYVVEAVGSNRLEGVTATCYYLGDELDQFGQPTGNKIAIEWDAEDYDQINPQITDEEGRYAWDVPAGQWKVRYEKEGYVTMETDWLDVPPPQTEVNVAMVSESAPEVESVKAYTDNVRLTFTQYMDINSVNTENVVLYVNGEPVEGEITPYDAEASFEDSSVMYARSFIFTPSEEIEGEVSVSVQNVLNYAGTAITSGYAGEHTVGYEPKSVSCDESVSVAYDSGVLMKVQILPAEAGAGQKLTAVSSSPNFVRVVNETVTADENGCAVFMLSGEMPGSANVSIAVDGTDVSAQTRVSVEGVEVHEIPKAAKVSAGIESGETIVKGTAVELVPGTDGAAVYYTLDGSDPTDEENPSRTLYEGAFELYEDTLVSAYSVCEGYEDSSVSGFMYYTIKADSETAAADAGGIYGDTITLTAEVSKAQSEISPMSAAEDTVEFSVNGQTLGTAAVEYEDEMKTRGSAELEVKLDKRFAIGDNTVKAEYGGSAVLFGSTNEDITVTVGKKPVGFTVAGKDREYDGTCGLEVEYTPSGVIGDDKLVLSSTAEIGSPNVGIYTTAVPGTITLSGADSAYYTVTQPSGEVTLTNEGGVNIEPKTVSAENANGVAIADIADITFTGGEAEPEPEVTDTSIGSGAVLVKGIDYSVSYEKNTEAGAAYVNVEFTGNYRGSLTKQFTIIKADSDTTAADVTGVYGDEVTLTASFSMAANNDEVSLMNETENTFEFMIGDVSLGTAEAVYTEELKTEGSASLTTVLDKRFMPGANTVSVIYTGNANLLSSGYDELIVNVECKELEYEAGGTERAYNGSSEIELILTPLNVIDGDDVTLTGTARLEGADVGEYHTASAENISIGGEDGKYYAVTLPAEPLELTQAAVITAKAVSDDDKNGVIADDPGQYTFTGEPIEPVITVRDTNTGSVLEENRDYSVSYRNNIDAGGAEAVVEFAGNYSGAMTVPFTISKAEPDIQDAEFEGVYGEQLTIEADIAVASGDVELMEATENTVEFRLGDVLLGTAEVKYDDELESVGTASLTVTLGKEFAPGLNTVSVVYGGGDNLTGADNGSVTVYVKPRVLGYTVAAADKKYDATAAAELTGTPMGALEGDDVGIIVRGEFPSAEVGEYNDVIVTSVAVSGADAGYYIPEEPGEMTALAAPARINDGCVIINEDGVWKVKAGTAVTGVLIIADYAQSGELLSLRIEPVEEVNEYEIAFDTGSATQTKLMLWRDIGSAEPLAAAAAVSGR